MIQAGSQPTSKADVLPKASISITGAEAPSYRHIETRNQQATVEVDILQPLPQKRTPGEYLNDICLPNIQEEQDDQVVSIQQ